MVLIQTVKLKRDADFIIVEFIFGELSQLKIIDLQLNIAAERIIEPIF